MRLVPVELGNAGVLAPGKWRWLRALLWLLALLFAVVATFQLVGVAQLKLFPTPDSVMPILIVPIVLSFLVYWAAVRWGERRIPSELGLRSALIETGAGLLIGAGMFTLVFTFLRLIGVYSMVPGNWNDWGHDLLMWLGGAMREELWFRLIILRLLMRAFGLSVALLASAALFGAAHLANPNASTVAAVAIAIEAGLMLAAFYLLTGRIWMAIGVHAAWNLFQGSVFGARVSGVSEQGSLFVSAPVAGTPDWLTGGPFGPEASLPAMLVGTAVFVLVLLRWRLRKSLVSDTASPLNTTDLTA